MEDQEKKRSRCSRCGRILKSKESIQLGYGPVCYKKVKAQKNRLFEMGEGGNNCIQNQSQNSLEQKENEEG